MLMQVMKGDFWVVETFQLVLLLVNFIAFYLER